MSGTPVRNITTSASGISVIIPTFNRWPHVCAAVDSALGQLLAPLEVIVVDDASSDGTVENLRSRYRAAVRVVALDDNVGGASARNRGVAVSSGRFVAFLDSDDVWYPQKLQRQKAVFNEFSSSEPGPLVYCQAHLRYSLNSVDYSPKRLLGPGERIDKFVLIGGHEIQTSGLLLERRLFDRVRFTEGLRRHQDIDFLIRLQNANATFLGLAEIMYRRCPQEVDGHVGHIKDDGVSEAWIESVRPLISTEAYHHFLLQRVMVELGGQNVRIVAPIVMNALRDGAPVGRALARLLKSYVLRLVRGVR